VSRVPRETMIGSYSSQMRCLPHVLAVDRSAQQRRDANRMHQSAHGSRRWWWLDAHGVDLNYDWWRDGVGDVDDQGDQTTAEN
jgi:hypothetical protein